MNELTKQGIELALDDSEEYYINNCKGEWTVKGVRDAKVEGVLKVVRLAVEELDKEHETLANKYYGQALVLCKKGKLTEEALWKVMKNLERNLHRTTKRLFSGVKE